PISNLTTGEPVGASLPGTTAGNPGPGVNSIISIKNNNRYKVTAVKLRINKKLTEFIPTVTKNTTTAELREIINKLSIKVLSNYIVYNDPLLPKIKFNLPPKFNSTKKEDLQRFFT
ncbi:hypothetical protein QR685DRAFT_443356, partial [Neurospora intermedia]